MNSIGKTKNIINEHKSFVKYFMISVFVIAAVLLFVVASFTPWIVGVGLGVVVGSAIVKVLLADLE